MAAAIQGALPEDPSPRWAVYGLALLAAFLVFDGLTSTAQDRLFAQYEMHSCTQLLWVSLWSAALRWVGGWAVGPGSVASFCCCQLPCALGVGGISTQLLLLSASMQLHASA